MLKKLNLTSIAYKASYKIGTVSRMKGLGYWNPQAYADGLTPRNKTLVIAKDSANLKVVAQKQGIHVRGKRSPEEENRLDLGNKVVVFMNENILEHRDE